MIRELEKRGNVFLTGKAGTGKSTLIKEYIERNPNTIVCAPTGVAAVNIDGETMHSVFGIPIPSYGVSISKTPDAKIKILAAADTVIIDEISMCRNDNFSYAMRVLHKAERLKGHKIKIIVCGDFEQLPPVITKTDQKYMKKFGYDLSGYPFTTKEWQDANFKVIELEKVYRQDNKEFIDNLYKVRDNDTSCIPYFDKFVITKELDILDPDINNFVIICGTNAEADRLNQEYLNSLPGNVFAMQSEKKGRTSIGIIDDIVLLKEGARVMFTTNDIVNKKYYNGTFGTVKKIFNKRVDVDIAGEIIPIFYHEYKLYNYKVQNQTLIKNEIGSISQIPLKIAKAITIHKSQGKTFNKIVLSPQIFAHGQLYVALSRVRTPEGLILTENLRPEFFKEDPVISEFYKNNFIFNVPAQKSVKKPETKSIVKKTKKKSVSKKSSSKRPAARKSVSNTTKRKAVKKKTVVKKRKD